jgi:hypothetical protein
LKDKNADQILEGAALHQLKAQAAVDEGGALIDFAEVALHTVGMGPQLIPGLSVCQKLELAIWTSRKVHEDACNPMSESVIELGRYLIDLAQLSMRMANDTKRELEIYMHQLADLVGDMAEAKKLRGTGLFREDFDSCENY